MSWQNLSLKAKLLAAMLTIAFLTAVMALCGLWAVSTLRAHLDEIAKNRLPSVQALNIINEAQTAIDGVENALLYTNLSDEERDNSYKKFDEIEARYKAAWKIYEPLPQTKEEEELWKKFEPAWNTWWTDHQNLIKLAKTYQAEKSQPNYEKLAHQTLVINGKSFLPAEELLGKIIALNNKYADDTAKTSTADAAQNVWLISVLGLSAVICAVLFGVILSSAITNTLKSIGQRLAEASTQVRAASQQMSSAAQQLASQSAEQASSIEETTASLEEMSGMVHSNVESASKAAELSQNVAEMSSEGDASMSRMEGSIKDILDSNEKIKALVKVISAIGEKTKVMDEIVFQTKLLSFNASVEAERAGEHGRGFAVVAQEVGNLAQMSGKAAQEIAQILSESIKSSEQITEENRRRVEAAALLVNGTAKSLKEILKAATSVTSGANQVLEASKEQSAGVKQVGIAMNNIEKATQESAALAEEVASTSEELDAQTDLLNRSVGDLTSLIQGAQ